jgi:hypothetical protein
MGLKEILNKGLKKITDKGSFFKNDLLLDSFEFLTDPTKEEYLKKLKKNGATKDQLEVEADRWDRANKKSTGSTGSTKSKEEPVKKFRGGLMRKPKLAQRGF